MPRALTDTPADQPAVWITGAGLLHCDPAHQTRTARSIPPAFGGSLLSYRSFDRNDEFEATHIANRPDRRAMGHQFSAGVCAASLALAEAELTCPDARRDVGMYVSTRMAERDEALDEALHGGAAPGDALNSRIMTGLRPTMFLSQLPNLLAGNLAIVTGLRGVSRTFVGEELAGVNAAASAERDVRFGRVRCALVGGSLNSAREEVLRWLLAAGHAAKPGAVGLAECAERGVLLGSLAAFAVLEADVSARARGRRPLASLETLARSGVSMLDGGSLGAQLTGLVERAKALAGHDPLWVMTNIQGVRGSSAALDCWRDVARNGTPVVLAADVLGSALEVDAMGSICWAVRALGDPRTGVDCPAGSVLGEATSRPRAVLVVTVGLERGLGAFLVRGVS